MRKEFLVNSAIRSGEELLKNYNMMAFCVWYTDTLFFPASYVLISHRFRLDTVGFLWTSCRILSVALFIRHLEAVGCQRFCYRRIPTGKLLPSSMYISGWFCCSPQWKRREVTEIDLVSSRFRRNPHAGIIALVE